MSRLAPCWGSFFSGSVPLRRRMQPALLFQRHILLAQPYLHLAKHHPVTLRRDGPEQVSEYVSISPPVRFLSRPLAHTRDLSCASLPLPPASNTMAIHPKRRSRSIQARWAKVLKVY